MKRLLAKVLGLMMAVSVCLPSGTTTDAQAKSTKLGSPEKSVDIPTAVWADLKDESGNPVKPRAAVLLIHGLGLHKHTYDAFAKKLNEKGVICYGIDVRGFGEWMKRDPKNRVDYPQTFQDIKVTLESMKKAHPTLPIYISGESMGGAIALGAAAKFQDLLDGMFSSVPAGDRVHEKKMTLKIAVHALTAGFNDLMPIGIDVINYGTQKDDLHKMWQNDPLGRITMTPNELMKFDGLCKANLSNAKLVNKLPVLLVQGGYDGLIVPAATTQLADAFPPENTDRIIAYSKNSEHLIFEYGRFFPEDIKYVTEWLDKHIKLFNDRAGNVADATVKVSAPGQSETLSYWIELLRDGKYYRCNNKMDFKSGDEIRFHMTPSNDGYVYVVMKESSAGNHMVLFPEARTGMNNKLRGGKECIVPTNSYLKFDENPGTEKLSVTFSRQPIDPNTQLYQPPQQVAYISRSADGSKDIVPTRMQLKWDDNDSTPQPEMVASALTSGSMQGNGSGVVNVKFDGGSPILAIDIALEHK